MIYRDSEINLNLLLSLKKIENESDIKVNFQVIANIPLYKKPDQQQYNIIKLKMN